MPSRPTADSLNKKIVLDARATQRDRMVALRAMDNPSRSVLLRLADDSTNPRRLRALAARMYADRWLSVPVTKAKNVVKTDSAVNQEDLDRDVGRGLAWHYDDPPLEVSEGARRILRDLSGRMDWRRGLISNWDPTSAQRLASYYSSTGSEAVRAAALDELRAVARLHPADPHQAEAVEFAAEYLRSIGDVPPGEPEPEPAAPISPAAPAPEVPAPASAQKAATADPPSVHKADKPAWSDPPNDPPPPYPRHPLPDGDTCRELNDWFRQALDSGATDPQRQAAENQLAFRIAHAGGAITIYALWLTRLLPWARRHPAAPLVLPGDRELAGDDDSGPFPFLFRASSDSWTETRAVRADSRRDEAADFSVLPSLGERSGM